MHAVMDQKLIDQGLAVPELPECLYVTILHYTRGSNPCHLAASYLIIVVWQIVGMSDSLCCFQKWALPYKIIAWATYGSLS